MEWPLPSVLMWVLMKLKLVWQTERRVCSWPLQMPLPLLRLEWRSPEQQGRRRSYR